MKRWNYIIVAGAFLFALLIVTWPAGYSLSTSEEEKISSPQTGNQETTDNKSKNRPEARLYKKNNSNNTPIVLLGGKRFDPSRAEIYRDDGKINLDLLRATKIAPTRYDEVQDIIDSSIRRLAENFRSRKVLIESESAPDKGVFSYSIPASDDSEKRRLESELKAAFGANATEILMAAASRSSSMGGLGTQEIKVKVDTDTLMGQPVERFTWTIRDPVTSRVLAQGGTVDRAEAWRRFGDFLAQ
jgi:hypothetical protein